MDAEQAAKMAANYRQHSGRLGEPPNGLSGFKPGSEPTCCVEARIQRYSVGMDTPRLAISDGTPLTSSFLADSILRSVIYRLSLRPGWRTTFSLRRCVRTSVPLHLGQASHDVVKETALGGCGMLP